MKNVKVILQRFHYRLNRLNQYSVDVRSKQLKLITTQLTKLITTQRIQKAAVNLKPFIFADKLALKVLKPHDHTLSHTTTTDDFKNLREIKILRYTFGIYSSGFIALKVLKPHNHTVCEGFF